MRGPPVWASDFSITLIEALDVTSTNSQLVFESLLQHPQTNPHLYLDTPVTEAQTYQGVHCSSLEIRIMGEIPSVNRHGVLEEIITF